MGAAQQGRQTIHGYDESRGEWVALEPAEAAHVCSLHARELGLLVVGRD